MANPPLQHAVDEADMRDTLRRIRAQLAFLHHENLEKLPIWTIFGKGTSDHPGIHVMRLFLTIPEVTITNCLVRGESVEQLRSLLPPGLHCLPRQPNDDANIIESWL